eukprot:scaffold127566_cov40-Cyclotella_meneghiniana.AAC.4
MATDYSRMTLTFPSQRAYLLRCCEFRILVGDWSAAVCAARAAAAISIDVVDFIAYYCTQSISATSQR